MMLKAGTGGQREWAVLAGFGRVFLAAAVFGALGACSLAQDVDPTGLLGDERRVQPTAVEVPEGDGETEAYPNLGAVSEEPPRRPSRREARRQLQAELASDRANARYSDDEMRAVAVSGTRNASASAQAASNDDGPPAPPSVASEMTGGENGHTDEAATASRDASAPATPAERPQLANADAGSPTPETAEATAEADHGKRAKDGREERTDIPQLRPSQRGEPVRMVGAGANGADARAEPASQSGDPARDAATRRDALEEASAATTSSRSDVTNAKAGDRVAVIHFRHGSHRLVGRDREVLRRVAELYREKGGRLRVVGHASSRTATLDPIAHRMANLDISLKRAEAVADALAAMKVRRGDIRVEARADREPVYHEFMPTGEAGNRRAEVYLAR